MLPSVLSAQMVSALSSPKKGRRNLGTWSEVSGHSAPPGTQKMAPSAEPDPYSDPNTILQTQDCLSQDYEGLQALAKVTLLFKKMFMEHLLCTGPRAVSPGTEQLLACTLATSSLRHGRDEKSVDGCGCDRSPGQAGSRGGHL